MSIAKLYTECRNRPVVSFELFPPRNSEESSPVWASIDRLIETKPDYVSVTFGASGSSQDLSRKVLRSITSSGGVPALAHLTCVGRDREQLSELIRSMFKDGIRNFLALRGDPPAGTTEWEPLPDGLSRASELVRLIRENAVEVGLNQEVSIAVAAYPAGAIQSRVDAVAALVDKQSSGADFAITQVFYEAKDYANLVSTASVNGVRMPIVPGVIPFTDLGRLNRLEGLSQVSVPQRIKDLLQVEDGKARTAAGIAATLDFIDELLEAGAPGLHLYTFNRTRPALDLLEHLRVRGFRPTDPAVARQNSQLLTETLHRMPPVA